VRINNIIRRSKVDLKVASFTISHPAEKALALTILKLPDSLEAASQDLELNRLTDLLYEISVKIGEFYTQCHVLGSSEEASRILLL